MKSGNLTPNQEKAIALYMAGKSQKEISDEIGVTTVTVSKWFTHNQAFRDTLSQRRFEFFMEYGNSLLPDVIKKLQGIMDSSNQYASLGAIKILLDKVIGDPKGANTTNNNITISLEDQE